MHNKISEYLAVLKSESCDEYTFIFKAKAPPKTDAEKIKLMRKHMADFADAQEQGGPGLGGSYLYWVRCVRKHESQQEWQKVKTK